MNASIIIRAYNAEDWIVRALKSACAQTYGGAYEILVVDDGSTDGTAQALKTVKDSRVRILSQENTGAVRAANIGFRASAGSHVVLLDADDEFDPLFLAETVAVAEADPGIDLAYADYREEYRGSMHVVEAANVFKTIAGGVLYRKASLESEGFYRPDLFFPEYDILLRTLGRWRSAHVARPLFTYHRSLMSLTAVAERVEHGIAQLRELHPTRQKEIDSIRGYALAALSEATV